MIKFQIAFLIIAFAISCRTTKSVSSKADASVVSYETALPPNDQSKLKKGIDLLASGNSPEKWQVELNTTDTLLFESDNGVRIAIKKWKRIERPDKSIEFAGSSGPFNLKLHLQNDFCDNSQQRKKVTVMVNEKIYTGCGAFLYDKALDGNWVLEKIESKWYKSSDFPQGLPNLNINMAKRSVAGSDGCNNFFGSFIVEGESVKFSDLSFTKKSCKQPILQNKLLKYVSNKTVAYFFKEGRLYFYLYDDSVLVYRRK